MVSFSFYFKVALGGFVITLSLVLLLTVPSRARPASPEKATYYVDTFEVTRKEKKSRDTLWPAWKKHHRGILYLLQPERTGDASGSSRFCL